MKKLPSSVSAPLADNYNVRLGEHGLSRNYLNVDKKNTPKNNALIALLDCSIDEVKKLRNIIFDQEIDKATILKETITLFDSYVFDFISAKDEATLQSMGDRLYNLLLINIVVSLMKENYKLDVDGLRSNLHHGLIKGWDSFGNTNLNPIFDELRRVPKFALKIQEKVATSSSKKELKQALEKSKGKNRIQKDTSGNIWDVIIPGSKFKI